MLHRESSYDREDVKHQLQDLQLKIARLEANKNKQPDEDEHLKELYKQFEQLNSSFVDNDTKIAA